MLHFRHSGSVLLIALAGLLSGQAVAQLSPYAESASFTLDTAVHILDTDGDGLPDWWEELYFGGPTAADAHEDVSGDGWTNLEKYNGGWNPWVPIPSALPHDLSAVFTLDMRDRAIDTDGDGLPDWWEELYFGGPTAANAHEDVSGDGWTNLQKYNAGLNPWVPHIPALTRSASIEVIVDTGGWPGGYGLDSDGDGMPDWWEVKYGLDPFVDDAHGDIDGDGITNIEKYLTGMVPHEPLWGEDWDLSSMFVLDTVGRWWDTDGDGLPDWWEELYFGGPSAANAHEDVSGDGWTNLEKYNAGWNPWVPLFPELQRSASASVIVDTGGWPGGYSLDTDGDGMPDWWEDKYFGGPTAADPDADPDGDGATNLEEYLAGTNPIVFDWFVIYEIAEGNIFLLDTGGYFADEDGDGLPNWWERRYSGSDTGLDAQAIADASGMTYFEKFVAYLDPNDPNAVFKIEMGESGDHPDGSQITIRWQSVERRVYQLYATDTLGAPWPETPIYTVEGDGNEQSCVVFIEDKGPWFFRVVVGLLLEEEP